MRYLSGIWLLILILGGCSNTRFLAEDQLLYTGQKKVHISMVPEDMSSVSERQLLQSGSTQKPNNSIFNRRVLPPIGLWVNNYWKIDEEKKIGKWAFNTLSSPPVLISDINPELRAQRLRMIFLMRAISRQEPGLRWILVPGIPVKRWSNIL